MKSVNASLYDACFRSDIDTYLYDMEQQFKLEVNKEFTEEFIKAKREAGKGTARMPSPMPPMPTMPSPIATLLERSVLGIDPPWI